MQLRSAKLWATACLFAVCGMGVSPVVSQETPPPPRILGVLGNALDAAQAGDLDAARNPLAPLGAVAESLVDWTFLRNGTATLDAHAQFLDGHAHWPLADRLQRFGEAQLASADAAQVLTFFEKRSPLTQEGRLALAFALRELDQAGANALARRLWLEAPLTEESESRLLVEFGDELTSVHADRVDALLWDGARDAAERSLQRIAPDQQALARARIALQQRQTGVDALVAAVPTRLRNHPGLAHDRFDFRYDQVSRDSAADLMLQQSRAPEGLGRPEAWASRRVALVRSAMSDGDYATAYALATPNGLEDGIAFVDLAFLAGFLALEHLDDPQQALEHFRALRVRVSSPISLGRAGYWEGRAHEALGDPISARAAYEFAAEHQTAYYGQLAADRIGLSFDAALIDGPVYPDWQETALARSDLLAAAKLLYDMGDWYEARRFLMHLATQLTSEAELGALTDLMLAWNEPNFALKLAKIAVQSGFVLPRAYFPLPVEPVDASSAPADLILAITRRESEFDPRARSRADARGLMQLLPGTGQMMARKLAVAFDPLDLTLDPGLNMRLGAAYLAELRDEFGPSLGLVAAGYNAGPGRPRRWVSEIGDPRDPQVDFVTWVERVPFAETRNYIMRVAESQIVYRSRLAGSLQPIDLEGLIRGR